MLHRGRTCTRLVLYSAAQWGRCGAAAQLHKRVAAGSLVRVRQGTYADAQAWESAKPEERMRARACALASAALRPPVFASVSAAAGWELPVWRADDAFVHVLDSSKNPARSRADVICHRGALPDGDVVVRDGLRVTSLAGPRSVRRRRRAYPDFSWPQLRRFGEFDGDRRTISRGQAPTRQRMLRSERPATRPGLRHARVARRLT
jgi:hypothetical protein